MDLSSGKGTKRAEASSAPEPAWATRPIVNGTRTCDGDRWVIVNPDWPRGDLPYRERCGGCSNCERA